MDELLRRADALLEVHRPADAVVLVERCLAQAPDGVTEAVAVGLLSRAQLALERPAEALSAAERLVALLPDASEGHLARSLALDALHRPEEALAACRSALRADPDHWVHHAQYAVLATQVRSASGDAMAAARTACELAPTEPQAHLVRGAVAGAQMRPEEAEAAYRRVLELDPSNAAARSNLAAGAGWGAGLGSQVEAYSSALQLDPTLDQARDHLERVAVVALRRAYWASAAALVVCVLVALQGGTVLRAVVGALALGTLAALALRLLRRTPPGTRAFLRDRVRHQPFLQVSAALTTIMLLATAWAAFAPLPGWYAPWVVRPLGFAGVAMLVADVVRRA